MILPTSRGHITGRLGFRLMGAIGLALLPLALLSYVQSERFNDEAVKRAEAALLGETLRAAAPQVAVIRRNQGVAATAAIALSDMVDDPAACADLMGRIVGDGSERSFAGFIPTDGRMTCSSGGQTLDFSGSPALREMVESPGPVITANRNGPFSGVPVLIFSHPVGRADGTLAGFVSVSAPHYTLTPWRMLLTAGTAEASPLVLATFDARGKVLTEIFDQDTLPQRLPVGHDLEDLARAAPVVFSAPIDTGQRRIFAVIPMVDNELYVLSSWMPEHGVSGLFGQSLPFWGFPALMWLASLIVAWLAAEHQMLRHIRALRDAMVTFGKGQRMIALPDLSRAPNELRDVGQAFDRMVDGVLHDAAELEDAVHQKEVLLREVHHRVKNNLQLIASIMNLQMRKAFSPEAKLLVKGLHDRVMSLATVHRELYQTSGLTDVRADELLSTIVAQVLRMGSTPGREPLVETHFDSIRLTPDQAVPLSLMLTEALANVLKHARPGRHDRVTLSVSLTRGDEGRATLRVANSLQEETLERTIPPPVDSTGLGEQLLAAFAMQLGGQLEVSPGPDGFVVEVNFPVRALSEAEERFVNT